MTVFAIFTSFCGISRLSKQSMCVTDNNSPNTNSSESLLFTNFQSNGSPHSQSSASYCQAIFGSSLPIHLGTHVPKMTAVRNFVNSMVVLSATSELINYKSCCLCSFHINHLTKWISWIHWMLFIMNWQVMIKFGLWFHCCLFFCSFFSSLWHIFFCIWFMMHWDIWCLQMYSLKMYIVLLHLMAQGSNKNRKWHGPEWQFKYSVKHQLI